MTNNFHAAKQQLKAFSVPFEAVVNAVPIKPENEGCKRARYMILKNLEQLEFWVDRAEKNEAQQ